MPTHTNWLPLLLRTHANTYQHIPLLLLTHANTYVARETRHSGLLKGTFRLHTHTHAPTHPLTGAIIVMLKVVAQPRRVQRVTYSAEYIPHAAERAPTQHGLHARTLTTPATATATTARDSTRLHRRVARCFCAVRCGEPSVCATPRTGSLFCLQPIAAVHRHRDPAAQTAMLPSVPLCPVPCGCALWQQQQQQQASSSSSSSSSSVPGCGACCGWCQEHARRSDDDRTATRHNGPAGQSGLLAVERRLADSASSRVSSGARLVRHVQCHSHVKARPLSRPLLRPRPWTFTRWP